MKEKSSVETMEPERRLLEIEDRVTVRGRESEHQMKNRKTERGKKMEGKRIDSHLDCNFLHVSHPSQMNEGEERDRRQCLMNEGGI